MSQKIAIVIRGIPGSGKTTFASLFSRISECKIHSVDDLHVDRSGNFSWDENNCDQIYKKNLENFRKDCLKGVHIVVCDCVNYKVSHIQDYLDIAKEFGYRSYVVTSEFIPISESSSLNKHKVPVSKLEKFYNEWESWPVIEKVKGLIFK